MNRKNIIFFLSLFSIIASGHSQKPTPGAEPFPLSQVRLLDGPFKHAMDKDAAWLLSLKPDRFLYRFRLNAGLQPKDSIYGGWEARGVSGHSLGHYLSACAMMYAASGDKRFLDKTNYIISQLAECQDARKTGYVGGIPDEDKIFNEVASGDVRSQGFDLNGGWVPWYTEHKVLAGILDCWEYTGNAQAKMVAIRFADWIDNKFKNLSEEKFQQMLDCEHGGMNESLANIYGITGDKKYLLLSYRFNHKKILDPLGNGEDILPGKHANTQIPKIIGAARQYELTGEDHEKRIAEYFWKEVTGHHSYVIGGNSDHEHFGEPDKLSDRLSTNTTETCNSYNMLKLTNHLFALNPSASYMDYYEKTLYNHILASQDPETGMTCYYVPLVSGAEKTYGTPTESFWCCTGTGMENHVKYGESIYYKGQDGSVFINLFIPSILAVPGSLSVKMETKYPEKENIRITVLRAGSNKLLKIRYPAWVKGGATVTINGKAVTLNATPGSYIILNQSLKQGDVIEARFPMSLYTVSMPDNRSKLAFLYGPLVLAGKLGQVPLTNMDIPVFVGQKAEPVKAKSSDLVMFTAQSANTSKPVQLIPFYRMHHEHYAVYWDSFTESQWTEKKAGFEKALKEAEDLKRRTIAEMRIGEMQPERDHNLQGEKTSTGEASGRKWRHAVDGGWFSFEMEVNDRQPLQLVCTYWGSDDGREFDILVDGQKLATEKLVAAKPNDFMDVVYPLPAAMLKGKKMITVKLQAHKENTAGGLFGARIVRRAGVPK